ncbi:MAG: GntR family transcriptional regulator [Anaerolineales bacterium]
MSLDKLGELDRSNLAIEVAGILRESITTGDFPPGMHLVEIPMAQKLGISRGPLREALRILETEGMVENFPGKGSFVTHVSERNIREVYSLRCILETEAIKLAIKNGTPDDFEELDEILKAMFAAAKEEDLKEVTLLDFQFHSQIWTMADHTLLKDILEGINTQIKRYVAVQTTLYDDLTKGISDHKSILETLRNQDEEAAIKLIKSHLEVASKKIIEHFQAKNET